MPLYDYKGQLYDLDIPDPAQAISKIKSHLGETDVDDRMNRLVDGKRLLKEVDEKTQKYAKDGFSGIGGELANLGLPIGILEQVPAGIQQLGALAAGGIGGAVGALIPGDDAASGFARSSEAFTDATSLLTPRTKSGQAIAAGFGAGVQNFKEHVGDPENMERILRNHPMLATAFDEKQNKELGKILGPGMSALAVAAPELAGVAPMGAIRAPKRVPQELPKPPSTADLKPTADRPAPSSKRTWMDEPVVDPIREKLNNMQDMDIQERLRLLDEQVTKQDMRKETSVQLAQEAVDARNARLVEPTEVAAQNLALERKRSELLQQQAQERAAMEQAGSGSQQWLAENAARMEAMKAQLAELDAQIAERNSADKARAADNAAALRAAQLEADVRRNVDLNEHGPNRTTLGPEGLRETAQERMDFVQDANRGATVVDNSVNGVSGLTKQVPGARAAQVGPDASPVTIITNQLREQAGLGLKNDPRVVKALQRVEDAEVLYLKAAEMAKEGRTTRSQLTRLQRDLDGLRAAAERTIGNTIGNKRSRMGGVGKKQGGAIDPDMFVKMFPQFMNSKMKGPDGKLKKYYTGTSKDVDFGEIKPNKRGAWFTEDPAAASQYAKDNESKGLKYDPDTGRYKEVNTADRVHEVYLNIENPYKMTEEDFKFINTDKYAQRQRELFEKLKLQGYDGVDFGGGTVAALKPESIRSTISPNGPAKGIKVPKGQKGAINPEVFKEGFEKLKQLADGTWLRAFSDGQSLTVEAVKDSRKLGGAVFEKTDKYNSPSETNMAATMVGSSQKGLATEVYKFASELGNDIVPSKIRTSDGTKMWESFDRKGLAENGIIKSPGNKQKGAITLASRAGKDVERAKKLLKSGLSPATVFKETGVYRDRDGRYKSVFSDSEAELNRNLYENEGRGMLPDFLDHPKLFELYPELKEVFVGGTEGKGGGFDINRGQPVINVGLMNGPHQFKQVLMHEIQHAIQTRDKMNRGTNIGYMQHKFGLDFDTAKEHYMAKGGEQEARFVERNTSSSQSLLEAKVLELLQEGKTPSNYIDEVVTRIKSPGNKQTGAIMLGPDKGPEAKILSTNRGIRKALGEFLPRAFDTPAEMAEVIKKDGIKDIDQNWAQKAINFGTKGFLYQALKLKNPLIEQAYKLVSNADRLARADVRDYVYDKLGKATRAMSKDEQASVWSWVSWADLNRVELTPELMREKGFTPKQMEYVKAHRETMDYVFDKINSARAVAGKEPIDRRRAYAAMRSTGDWRKLVYKTNSKGEKQVVGVIGSDWKQGINRLTEQMKKQGYEVGEERYFGGVPRERGSAQQALMQAVEYLADTDPMAKEFVDALAKIYEAEHYNFLNMKTHTMEKKGVFGMEGRKQWKDARDNAKEGLGAQLQYAEAGIKWGHLSESAAKMKEFLKDPNIDMPNAKKLTEGYVQNSLGYNPVKFGRDLEQGVANFFDTPLNVTGMGYSNVRKGMAVARQGVNSVLLGLNPAFWFTQFVQPFQTMPGMRAYLGAKGLDLSKLDGTTGYEYIAKGGVTALKQQMNMLKGFEKEMVDYASDFHVYGSDLVEHSNRPRKDLGYAAVTISNVGTQHLESSTRRAMFYGFSHMLKENGMKPGKDLFEAAHNLTDATMVNYSATERPNAFNAMGPVGDLGANLQMFKYNELSRFALFARQVAEEKTLRPAAIQLASSVAFAGIKGVILYQEADWLYKYITKKLGKPDSLNALVFRMSENVGKSVNKLTGVKDTELGDARHVLSHGGFSLLGADMSSRLGMDVIPDSLGDLLFPGQSKVGDVFGAAWEATKHPTEMNIKRAIREPMPGIMAGPMDRGWFSKRDRGGNELAVNRNSLEGQVWRSPADKFWKSVGATGIHESVEKAKTWEVEGIKRAYADLRSVPLKAAHDELYASGKVSPATVQKYLKYEGNLDTLTIDLTRTAREQNMAEKDVELLKAAMGKTIASINHAKRLVEIHK